MRLARVRIKNFRSISDETIVLDPPCRVLVGINESGKSNILRALSLLDPRVIPNPDDLRDALPGEAEDPESRVRFIFAVTPLERLLVLRALREETLGGLDHPIFQRAGRTLSLSGIVNTWSELIWRVNVKDGERHFARWADSASKIKEGWYRPTKTASSIVNVNGKPRPLAEFAAIEKPTEDIPADELIPLTVESVLDWILAKFAKVVKIPKVVFWKYDEENLLPGSIALDEFSSDPDMCLPLKHMFMLAKHEDAAEAISIAQKKTNGLRNLLEAVSRAATKHVASVWKEFKNLTIEISQNGSNLEAIIKDVYNRFDLSRRSDGCKRFISFLLSVSAQDRSKKLVDTLYLQDEPDTSLHPAGARYLRDELIRLSNSNYVVYSTHSIFMIDRENLRRHLIVEKRKETTVLREVTVSNMFDEEVVYNALGHSIFRELSERNIIFEGWRDKRLFRVRMSKLPSGLNDRVVLKEAGVCHAKGVSDIGRIAPMLELAQRRWIVVSDADTAARQHQRSYDGDGPWFRYDELGAGGGFVTSEDFIDWSAFQKVLERIAGENPSLRLPSDWESMSGEGKIAKFREWMKASGMEPEQIKASLESIKEQVFNDLKPAQIRGEYTGVITNIGKKLAGLKAVVL